MTRRVVNVPQVNLTLTSYKEKIMDDLTQKRKEREEEKNGKPIRMTVSVVWEGEVTIQTTEKEIFDYWDAILDDDDDGMPISKTHTFEQVMEEFGLGPDIEVNDELRTKVEEQIGKYMSQQVELFEQEKQGNASPYGHDPLSSSDGISSEDIVIAGDGILPREQDIHYDPVRWWRI
jgi:hypothetical protein